MNNTLKAVETSSDGLTFLATLAGEHFNTNFNFRAFSLAYEKELLYTIETGDTKLFLETIFPFLEKTRVYYSEVSKKLKEYRHRDFAMEAEYKGRLFYIGVNYSELSLLFPVHYDDKGEGITNIVSLFEECLTKHSPSKPNQIGLIVQEYGSYKISNYEIPLLSINLEENYNDGIIPFHDKFVEHLNTPDSRGLHFLHGKPGTGKTTYIRWLVSKLNKQVIYIQPEDIGVFSAANFIPFVTEHQNSILILEEAENVLLQKDTGNPFVSTILNMSDGILGDCFKFNMICTFNAEYNNIDPALKRKGRLIFEHIFSPLSVEKSNKILEREFPGKGYEVACETVLSDLYNYESNNTSKPKSNNKIGF